MQTSSILNPHNRYKPVSLIKMAHFVYILECTNGHYYIGYTTDIKRRYQEHLSRSSKCKYTRSFPPKRLAACWKIKGSLSLALKIERVLKTLTKTDKQQFANYPKLLTTLIPATVIKNT